MKLRPSEDHIRSLFENHERPIDTDKLWEQMQKKEKPKRRVIWLRFLWGLIPLFLIGGVFVLWNNDSPLVDKTVSSEISSPTKDPAILKHAETEKVALLEDGTYLKQERNTTNEQLKKSNISENNSMVSEKLSVRKAETSPYSASTDSTIYNKNNSGTAISNEFEKSSRVNIGLSQEGTTTSSSMVNVFNSNISGKSTSAKKAAVSSLEKASTSMDPLSAIAGVGMVLFYDRAKLDLKDEVKVIPRIEEEIISINTHRSLTFLTGIGLGNKNLANNIIRDSIYLESRNIAEELHSVWNGKLLLGFHKNGYIFSTGIAYSQHLESLRFKDQTRFVEVKEDTVSTIIDGEGNVLSTQTGPVTFTSITNHDFQKRNRYHYIGIPIEFGKEFIKGKWNWAIYGSSEINVAIKRSGAYLNGTNSFLDFSNVASEKDYSKKMLFQLGLRSQLSYEFKEGVSLSISPYASKYINSLGTSENQLSERPLHYGLGIGLTYHFYNAQ